MKLRDFINCMPEPLQESVVPGWPRIKEDLTDINKEPEREETDRYYEGEKDEFYAIVTYCKRCWTSFIAYDNDNNYTNNFCPGCGRKLKLKRRNQRWENSRSIR